MNAKLKTSSLYLLMFPDKGLLKIGKADDIHKRGKQLQVWWGKPDYAKSFEVVAPTKAIFKLEKSLHFMLSGYSKPFESGDGKSEMFSDYALAPALACIDNHISLGCVGLSTRMGVPSLIEVDYKPPKPEPESRRRERLLLRANAEARTHPRLNRLRASWTLQQMLIANEKAGWAQYTIEDFTTAMEATEKQKENFAKIRTKIIEPAIRELQDKDGWLIQCKVIKAGRRVSALRFDFIRNQPPDPM